ncbi:MAG: LPXTG cell wall anchor domain-containing protein [Lachnospiraceae bacterium]|nr:LPXTG cell wall anchor domain-containing protein [Lachnospiraceae bacterium]
MNFKDKLTKKLLETGKKHRLLVYPTLALVAIITAISHAVYWGRGNGKRFVASAMIMVMLFTQSLFLTSSANVTTDEGQAGTSTEISSQIPDGPVATDNGELNVVSVESTDSTTEATTESTSMDIINPDELNQIMNNTEATTEEASDNTTEAIADGQNVQDTTETVADGHEVQDTTEAEVGASTESTEATGENPTSVLTNTQFGLNGDTTETPTPQGNIVNIYRVDENNVAQGIIPIASHNYGFNAVADDDTVIDLDLPAAATVLAAYAGENQDPSHFKINGLYEDVKCDGISYAGDKIRVKKNASGTYNIYCKITRTAYPVIIDVDGQTVKDVATADANAALGTINPTATYNVPAKDANIYKGCEGEGAYGWGKNYIGLKYDDVHHDVNASITIDDATLSTTYIELKASWEMQTVTVTYDFVSDADEHIEIEGEQNTTKTYQYDDSKVLPLNGDTVKTTNEGYYLVGWSEDGSATVKYKVDGEYINSKDLVTKGADIKADPNMVGKTLTAVWAYKNNTLVATGNGVVSGKSTVTVTGTYGNSVNSIISAKYEKDGKANFGLLISDTDIANALKNYGIVIKPYESANGIVSSYSISGDLDNITDPAGATINLTLTDYNRPDGDQTFPCKLIIVSNQREVSLDPTTIKHHNNNGIPKKEYDGNDIIKVNTQADVNEKVGSDDVYVTFDEQAILDNANAGEGKAITLSNVKLDGDQADMYKLTDLVDGSTTLRVEGIATVTRIALTVTTSLAEGSSDSILFGQESPVYTVDIASPSLLAPNDLTRYNKLDSAAAKEAFMKQVIGFTGTWDTTRTLYSPANSYTITPVFSSAGVNYSVDATGITKTFTVGRDSGDGHYALSPEPVNGYYPKLTITASGGKYERVRLITDESDIAEGSTPSEVVNMFSESVTITDDMTNGTIMFQMYDNDTGAITYPVKLTGINIDGSGPTLVDYTVSPNVKYFNEYKFGSYYHAQTIEGTLVESVDITFDYHTDDSECDKLVYYFTDEDGNTKSEFNGEVKLLKNAMTNNYTATVTIGTGVSGQLVVYAVDTTGNPSGQSKVKLTEAINFIKEGQSAENYYEWMIENTIKSADIVVTDLNGNGTDSGVWYNGLNFNVLAVDSDSGVNKITWSITDPTGTVTPITESAHDSVAMVINQTKKGEATSYGKLTAYDFNTSISGEDALVGEYYVTAVLYDNAGNSVPLEDKGPFLFDGKAPRIECDDYEAEGDEYLSGVVFDFNVTEGENESGVATVQLYYGSESEETLLGNWGPQDSYSKEITSNGTYIVVATDVAGNVARREVTFSGISDVIPTEPIIQVDGTLGNDNWYIEELPTVTILSEDETTDGVPVTTTYKLTVGGNQIQANVDDEEEVINITSEGEILLEAWSKSKADCTSAVVSKNIKIDINGPKITITDSSVDSEGNTLIKFTVTDEISGVDPEEVYVNGEKVQVTEDAGVVTGSFVANNDQTYSIVASDIAGNESDATDFAPLTLKVSPVINITPTGAYIDAKVIAGTYPISDCYIAYKKASENDYDTALSNKHKEDYGISMDYTFRNLDSDTVYDYRVYAIASNSNEVKVVEGSFRTADLTSTATVYGSVTYAEDIPDAYKTYPVYVALYDANTVIAGVQLETADDVDYIFKNVADGNYRIVASNGMLNEVSTVTVTKGGISYPTDYAAKGGVHFVLDGLSTDVVVEDNSISITADGLDKIYNTALYNGNVTDEDLEVVEAGGTVNITLYASYINVSGVDKTTESIFIDKIGKNGIIERYIQLYVVKEVKDVDGKLVNGTPTNITRLAEPVTISFPLGDLSGQKVYVASVHQSGNDYAYINWAGSDVTLSQNYVTISTDRFSVYALYRLIETKKEYTVKWIDGDGNIMKTETVVEGNAATPPVEIPKKAETEKYTYEFSGWDTDYSKIGKDTVISAWFVAKEKEVTPPPTTEPPATEAPTTEAPKDDNNKNDGKDDITKEPTNYPYMGSGISPQTGDEMPIIALIALMIISASGMVVLNKKKKEE